MEHPGHVCPARYDQLSPLHSITDQDSEKVIQNSNTTSPHASKIGTDQDIPKRLAQLAHLASQNAGHLGHGSETLLHCLDTLESLLDPRSSLTQEIARCRPHNMHPSSIVRFSVSHSASKESMPRDQTLTSKNTSISRLAALHNDIATMRMELDQRRNEAFQIYDLFAQERQKLVGRISELEDEINELHTDMLEDAAEREALEGTVRGLEGWIDGWQVQHDLSFLGNSKRTSPRGGRGWWAKRRPEQTANSDTEALLEGISAWMRGWKDVEDGFRNRERVRKVRRNGRQRGRMIAGSVR